MAAVAYSRGKYRVMFGALAIALAACAAGGDIRKSGPPPRPKMDAIACHELIATASPKVLSGKGVALVLAEPELIEGGQARPIALRLREQLTGEEAVLDCLETDARRAVVWGAVPPGRWHVVGLEPAGGAEGPSLPLPESDATRDELRLGAGETMHLSHPVWTRAGGTLTFRSDFEEKEERRTVKTLAPNVGTALLLRELGKGG